MGLSINIRSRDRTREPETRRPGCPTASLLQDWVSLPGLVDGVASPDPEHVLASAMQLEVISRRHPEWLNPFQATLSCVAGLQRCGPAGLLLQAMVDRLACRQSQGANGRAIMGG